MSYISPLNFTTSAELYAYTQYFYVASVIMMCKGDEFLFAATYDHKGYYGTMQLPVAKRALLQEPYVNEPFSEDIPVAPPVPTACELITNGDLKNTNFVITSISLESDTIAFRQPNGTNPLGSLNKITGAIYHYGLEKITFINAYTGNTPIFGGAILFTGKNIIGNDVNYIDGLAINSHLYTVAPENLRVWNNRASITV